jgi:hypothetical protein
MKNSRLLLILGLFLAFSATSFGQDYSQAIGARLSPWTGLTYKKQLKEGRYGEGLLMWRWGGFEVTGLYEVHKAQLAEVDRLNWYFGGGAHVGFYRPYWGRGYGWGNPWAGARPAHEISLGVDGILGIEYNIEELPLNISIDWKPGFNIIGSSWGVWDNGAVSVRYYW